MKRPVLAVALAVGLALGQGLFGWPAAHADPAPLVPPHRHFIVRNGERVFIGPDFCNVDANAKGFAQFHANVHLTDPGSVDVQATRCE